MLHVQRAQHLGRRLARAGVADAGEVLVNHWEGHGSQVTGHRSTPPVTRHPSPVTYSSFSLNPVTPIGTSPSFGVRPLRRLASIFASPAAGTGVCLAICARAEAR